MLYVVLHQASDEFQVTKTMEFLILSFSLIFVTLYYVFLTFNIISNRNKIAEQNLYHLPPGSSGWPIVGETLDYLKTAKNGVPEKFTMDRRNKYSSDVFKTSLLGETMVFLPTPQGNKFIFANENKLVKSWWPKNFKTIFDISEKTTVSDESARMKKLLFPLLKPNSLRKYVGIMDLSTIEHTKTYWDGKEVIKVHALAKKYAFSLVCTLFLNIEDLEIIAKLEGPVGQISSGLASSPINIPGTKFNRAITSSKKIKKEIEKIVAQRRIDLLESNGSRANDIVSDLLVETYDDGEPINDSGIAKVLVGLLVGAHDTVSTTLVCIMSFLAELPEVYDKVFKEQMKIANEKASGELLNWEDIQKMRYSWNVVCEVLRLSPPSPGAFRVAITDFMYEGFFIPKGFKLHWNVFATHRNPEFFPEPEKFEPSRFEGNGPVPFSYVPFGGGPRMCPGNEYARVKILLVFIHNVVKNFKWEKVFPDEKLIRDPTLAPERGLPIRLYPAGCLVRGFKL